MITDTFDQLVGCAAMAMKQLPKSLLGGIGRREGKGSHSRHPKQFFTVGLDSEGGLGTNVDEARR